jgi:hypothetical protein
MKFFTVLLLFVSTSLFCQTANPLVGYTEEEIRQAFPESKFKTETFPDKGIKILITSNNLGKLLYVFEFPNPKNYSCTLEPKDDKTFYDLIKLHNEKYIVVSKSEWTVYTDNGTIMTIQLLSDGEGGFKKIFAYQ